MKTFLVTTVLVSLLLTNSNSKTDWEKDNLKGLVKSITSISYDGNYTSEESNFPDSAYGGSTTTLYDEFGYKVEERHTFAANRNVDAYVTKFERNANSQLVKESKYTLSDSLISSKTYEYDSNGILSRVNHYDKNVTLTGWAVYYFDLQNKDVYRTEGFDAKGKQIDIWKFNRNEGHDTAISSCYSRKNKFRYAHKFVYDTAGQLIEHTNYDENDKVFYKMSIAYLAFDQHGNWTKRISTYALLDKNSLRMKKVFKRLKITDTTYTTTIRSLEYY